MTLNPHPRLYLGNTEFANCRNDKKRPFLQEVHCQLVEDAATYLDIQEPDYQQNVHNEHLLRARSMQTTVVSLLCRYIQTRDNTYKEAILAYIRMVHDWDVWSWITWREGNPRPDAIFDLSYGENSVTLAIAYDGLFNDLSDDEKQLFVATAEKWAFPSWRKNAAGSWWLGKADSNWNSVCAGGMGMLAMAMYEDVEDADEVLELAKRSLIPFFNNLDAMNGGWPEGVGYWNYGMRYAFMFLLSLENAFERQEHEITPFLQLPGVRKTLYFPLDFCPFGITGGFGDANNWRPLPFHYAAALRLNCPQLPEKLLALAETAISTMRKTTWPDLAEWLFMTPEVAPVNGDSWPDIEKVKLYDGLDWGRITDDVENPGIYVTFRGGTTQVPHSHADLMSFNYFQKGELMIVNTSCGPYMDTTFSPRRWELTGMNAQSKNSIIINGVGVQPGSALNTTEQLDIGALPGIRMDATDCFGEMRNDKPVNFAGRIFLLLPDVSLLIVDHVDLKHVGLIETRMHTHADHEKIGTGFVLRGKQETTFVTYGASVECVNAVATTAPAQITLPTQTVLRYATVKQVRSATFATLLSTGDDRATAVSVSADDDAIKVLVSRADGQQVIAVDRSLRALPAVGNL